MGQKRYDTIFLVNFQNKLIINFETLKSHIFSLRPLLDHMAKWCPKFSFGVNIAIRHSCLWLVDLKMIDSRKITSESHLRYYF
jgi:hypothetical protein